jgi:hypothetical protein
MLGRINPSWDVPVLLGNHFENTTGVGSVGYQLLESLWEFLDTEEDPIMEILVVELVLELVDAEKRSVDVVILN